MKKSKTSVFGFLRFICLQIFLCLLIVSCGDKDDKGAGGATEETKGIAITDKEVAGVSQKGPFLTGSLVHLYELNGIDFIQTGKSFAGKTNSDKGDFSISKINLKSQYALLEAHGYYRNEVTGSKSVSQITLNAVTDLENRDRVNINLLTHLAYERIRELVQSDEDVSAAKEQSEKEVFSSFYITGDFAQFEDMDIFNGGEGDAALLAISVLMQGARSEAELSELLALYANDVAVDGTWDDEELKVDIADWAETVCLKDRFAGIRKNVENWGFGRVPSFEKYAMRFWWYNYGLGLCELKRQGEIKKNQNTISKNADVSYICEGEFWHRLEDSSSSTVEESSSSQKDESSSSENTESSSSVLESSSSVVPSSSSKEDFSSSSEELSSSNDMSSSSEKMSSSVEFSSSSVEASSSSDCYSGDISTWPTAEDGMVVVDCDAKLYVYDESDGWRSSTTEYDLELKMGCTVKRNFKHATVYDEVFARDEVLVCFDRKWSTAERWNWDLPKEAYFNENIDYGTMTDSRDGHVYRTTMIGGQVWMAENLNYYDVDAMPELDGLSWCYGMVGAHCDVTGRLYTWSAAIDSVRLFKEYGIQCGTDSPCVLKGVVEEPLQGVCPVGWHLPTKDEFIAMRNLTGSKNKKMKTVFGWGDEADDEFGISLMPAGMRNNEGYFLDVRNFAYFWTSTGKEGESRPRHCFLGHSANFTCVDNRPLYIGMSVRCVMD